MCPMKAAWRDSQVLRQEKNHGSAWQPKMSTLSVLPGEPSVAREIAQEEDAALFEAVLNPKPHKDSLQECLQGKTEDASPGLAWR